MGKVLCHLGNRRLPSKILKCSNVQICICLTPITNNRSSRLLHSSSFGM
uniref:Bm13402 n=1 Tax=Brugia malayi TaxID=6279 RepID=A0A1I9G0T6_BRUMA|nr:Bm13402 [Brugia malayi]